MVGSISLMCSKHQRPALTAYYIGKLSEVNGDIIEECCRGKKIGIRGKPIPLSSLFGFARSESSSDFNSAARSSTP
jgi:hypothetical protein